MAGQDHSDQPMEEVEWGEGAGEFDQAITEGQTTEITFDNDEPPSDSDGGDAEMPDDDELGEIDEEDEDVEPVDDISVATGRHKDAVLSVALNPCDSRMMVTGGQDDVGTLWTLEQTADGYSCTQRCQLDGHTDSVVQVAFSNDGKYVASGSYDGTVRIWDAASGALVHALDGPSKEVEWLVWHPKGHAILAGSTDTMAWMWWAPTGKLMQIFAGHAQSVTCGCWGLGGKTICTGSEDGSAIVWNPRQGAPTQNIKGLHDSSILSICSHPELPIMVTGSQDAVVKAVHMETGKQIATLTCHTDSVEAVAFSEIGTTAAENLFLATAAMDGKVAIWDGKTFDLRCELKDHCGQGGVVSFKWLKAPRANMLCTCSTDNTLRLFDALAATCIKTFTGHTDTVLGLDIFSTSDALCIVSGADDKTCKVFVHGSSTGIASGSADGQPAGGYAAAVPAPAPA